MILALLSKFEWHYILPPIVGAVIGYVTNAIAVKMLFKPYKTYRVGKIRVPFTPGIIPRQRDKISQGIGEIVSHKLLNTDTMKRAIKTRAMRNAIVLWLRNRITDILNYPISTIGELLKRLFSNDFEHYYHLLLDKIKSFLSGILKNEKNKEILTNLLDKVLDTFLNRSVEEFIGTDVIQNAIAKLTSSTLQEEQLQDKILQVVEDFFNHIFVSDKSIKEVIPDTLVDVIGNYIKSRLPSLLENLSDWLDDPKIKTVIQKKVLQVLTDYVGNLNFLQSVVVGLLGVEDKVAAQVPYFIDRLGGEISELANDPTFINYLEEKVEYFLDNFLEKKMSSLTSETGIPLKKLLDFFRGVFADIIKDPDKIKSFLADMTSGFSLEKKKLSEFINDEEKRIIKSRILKSVFSYLSDESGIDDIMNFLSARLDNFLYNKEIGPLNSIFTIKRATVFKLSKRGMRYGVFLLDRELPIILKSLDIEKMVRERIDSFPLDEVEDIILRIIKDQLKWINVFGGLLGFLIGCIQLIFK